MRIWTKILNEIKGKLNKKAQGLPMYVIAILIIGLIALVLVLLYLFGVFGEGSRLSDVFFWMGGNITENATEEAAALGR